MASKQTAPQSKKDSSASAPPVATTTPAEGIDLFYRIVLARGPQVENIVMDNGSPSPKSWDFITITGDTSDGSTMVDCEAKLEWRRCGTMEFHCVYDTKTGVLEDFEWTNENEFGEGIGDENELIKDVSISMREKSIDETGEAVDKEILDDLENPFLVVVMVFVSEKEEGILYGKKADGDPYRCFLSTEEKERLSSD